MIVGLAATLEDMLQITWDALLALFNKGLILLLLMGFAHVWGLVQCGGQVWAPVLVIGPNSTILDSM
jgi:hypothetical protein